jgi:acyl phosphate:glycerol-3-phosphate acyltransferase
VSLLPAAATVLGAYLLGAIPFGLIIAKALAGVDVRTVGSGNIGATNVLRAAGAKAAVLTLLADAIKGWFPVLLAGRLFPEPWVLVLTAIAAIAGHNYPVFLRFRGGKGVATSLGVVLAAAPGIGLLCIVTWLAAALLWRYSSLAALVSFAVYPLATFATRSNDAPQGALSLFVFGMIYYRHRENIKRLLAGTEPRIGRKK